MAGGEGCRDERRGSSASEVGTVDGTAKKKSKKNNKNKTGDLLKTIRSLKIRCLLLLLFFVANNKTFFNDHLYRTISRKRPDFLFGHVLKRFFFTVHCDVERPAKRYWRGHVHLQQYQLQNVK